MPLVRALPESDEGRARTRGGAPRELIHQDGGAEPRLTSGGRAGDKSFGPIVSRRGYASPTWAHAPGRAPEERKVCCDIGLPTESKEL